MNIIIKDKQGLGIALQMAGYTQEEWMGREIMDIFNLQRFLDAQAHDYDHTLMSVKFMIFF